MSDDPLADAAIPMMEKLLFSGVLDDAERRNRELKAADPEWSVPRHTHVKDIIQAFVYGVLSADPWHKSYKLPPDFESVVNWIAFNVQRTYGNQTVVEISLIELERKLSEWASQHKSYRRWGECDDGRTIGIVTAMTPTADHRDFIDLGALLKNACVYLRDQRRLWDQFEERIKEKKDAGDDV